MSNSTMLPKKIRINTFFPGSLATGIFSPITLQAQLKPLFEVQTELGKGIAKLHAAYTPVKTSIDYVNSALVPVDTAFQAINSSLLEVNKMAEDTKMLYRVPVCDYLNEPLLSTLSSGAELIKNNQNRLFACVSQAKDNLNQFNVEIPDYIKQINSLGSLAIDYLKSSTVLFPIVDEPEVSEMDKLKEKVERLESKVEKLENEKRDSQLTDITVHVCNKLEKLDPTLEKIFGGAIVTLTANQSEDLVGQVAESLTRVIERLPFVLCSNVAFTSSKKKGDKIIEALCRYLKTTKDHHLIAQQKSFYSILGNIRHRNGDAYQMYNQDIALFKAFVVQIEAFIYILTFGNG